MPPQLLYVIAFLVAVAIFYRSVRHQRISDPNRHALDQALKDEAVVVDVRTRGEFANNGLIGAKNIPVDQLPERLTDLPKERPVIVYCASGMRSRRAKRFLEQQGFERVVDAGARSRWPYARAFPSEEELS